MNESRRAKLSNNMLVCSYTVKQLLMRIAEIENDTETSLEDKVSQIKKIKDEITKVGTEIDSIKKEITLLNAYNVNWGRMPTYLYECPTHGEFEHQHSINDQLEFCPRCQEENPPVEQKVKRLIAGGSGFILNGSGWAKDNYS